MTENEERLLERITLIIDDCISHGYKVEETAKEIMDAVRIHMFCLQGRINQLVNFVELVADYPEGSESDRHYLASKSLVLQAKLANVVLGRSERPSD